MELLLASLRQKILEVVWQVSHMRVEKEYCDDNFNRDYVGNILLAD